MVGTGDGRRRELGVGELVLDKACTRRISAR
jgi:hypothetical protein